MWRKDWSELRWLGIIGLAIVVGITLLAIGNPDQYRRNLAPGSALVSMPAPTFVEYNGGSLTVLFPVVVGGLALLLGIGGLGHERAGGTASFTLTLPFSRRAMVMSRFLAGALVVVVVAIAAHLTVAAWAAFHHLGAGYPAARALGAAASLAAGSLSIYAFMFFVANVTANTVRAVATSVVLLGFLVYSAGTPYQAHHAGTVGWWLQPADFVRLMSGVDLLSRGHLPWLGIVDAIAVTVALGYFTLRWVERHDF